MVELRKRPPPKEPLDPAPAAKKSRAKPAAKQESVADKAKAAAAKVKDAVTGSGKADTTNEHPTATADEALVETGETGMIPETAGTAPSTTTVPAEVPAPTEAVPSATTGKGRGRGKKAAAQEVAPTQAAASTEPVATSTEAHQPQETIQTSGLGSSIAQTEPATAMALDPPASTTANPASETEDRPPTTEELENPPEKGAFEPATTSTTTTTSPSNIETATLPLSATSVGKQIPSLSTFGGHIETHTGTKVSVSDLLSGLSSGGIIIFTYPRASTPGCTTQACSFRDNHDAFTATSGYKIYGLSTDSTKANMGFATKQNLQYELLCDPAAGLTGALGMKKAGNAKGTLRGVVVIDGNGVVKVWFQGGPGKTVDVVREYLETVK